MATKQAKKATRGAASRTKPQKKASSARKTVAKKKPPIKKSKPVKASSVAKKKTPAKKKVVSKKSKSTKKPVKKAPTKKVTPKGRVAKKPTATRKSPVKKKTPAKKKSTSSKKKTTQKKKTTPRKTQKRKPQARKASSPTRTRPSRSSRRTIKSFIRIKVVGVGGGGGNAITRMRNNFSVRGVEFVAVNTDIQDLEVCDAHKRLNIGRALTKGMGAGMNPDLGQQAAEENRAEIAEALRDADMIFLTAGFGGGTGTGASPVIADIAREMGILTVAVVTKPFGFEGSVRTKIAEEGIMSIKDRVDTLLVIPNDRIFSVIDKNTSVTKAFEKIDEVLQGSVQGVAEVIASSGLVNVDFADIRAIMAGSGVAVVGVGIASGADRAVKAVNQAIHSPLLDVSIDGAKSVLFGVAGGADMRMAEVNDAAKIITDVIDQGAKIIFGAYRDRRLKAGELKITLIATGFNGMTIRSDPDSLTLFNERLGSRTDSESLIDDVEVAESIADEGENRRTLGKEEEKTDEEIWDIPAFLRKKGKRK